MLAIITGYVRAPLLVIPSASFGLGIQFHSYSALIELLPDDCGTVGTGDARVPLARLGHVFG